MHDANDALYGGARRSALTPEEQEAAARADVEQALGRKLSGKEWREHKRRVIRAARRKTKRDRRK